MRTPMPTANELGAFTPTDFGVAAARREFCQTDEDCYALALPSVGIEFHANYLRRDLRARDGSLGKGRSEAASRRDQREQAHE